MLAAGAHERRWWEQMTMHAEVEVKSNGQRGSRPLSLHEWGRHNMAAVNRGSEYLRVVSDATVLSHSEARAIIRQREKELGLNRPTPSRGR